MNRSQLSDGTESDPYATDTNSNYDPNDSERVEESASSSEGPEHLENEQHVVEADSNLENRRRQKLKVHRGQ
ncbi:hypothetical protein QE152_g30610 [Popillia japonica]|uniref:Uncharacterized protein n=1 Tax=Popillia japonica TaxID=7064 RepID=A0AAW1JD43_POPJA